MKFLAMVRFLVVAFVLYCIFALFFFFMQRKMMYFPNSQDFNSCGGFGDAEKIDINGTRAYFKKTSDKLIVVYHGNAGSACDRTFLKEIFEKLDYSYLFVEYSGYSNDKRKPSKELLLNDVRNVNGYLSGKNFEETALFGESLGTGLASYHSTLAAADKIILVEPFDSILNFTKRNYRFLPVQTILKEDYDNIRWLRGFKGEITIIHGKADDIMPLSHAENLFRNINSTNKNMAIIDGAGHNDIYNHIKTQEEIIRALS
jgi:uncharacterized protein